MTTTDRSTLTVEEAWRISGPLYEGRRERDPRVARLARRPAVQVPPRGCGNFAGRRGTGATTPETSLYSPLESLMNAVGGGLKPRVRCFMSLKNQGAGMRRLFAG